jgi:hypothetical protein
MAWGFTVQNALYIPSHGTLDEQFTMLFIYPFLLNLELIGPSYKSIY